MCYSEKLSEANAFQGEHGWVYLGWKAFFIHSNGSRRACGGGDDIAGHFEFSVGALLRDSHGFHVAATHSGAFSALLGILRAEDDSTERAVSFIRKFHHLKRHLARLAIYPVLIPEHSADAENHCHAMVVCSSRTPRDSEIAAADAENLRYVVEHRKRAERQAKKQAKKRLADANYAAAIEVLRERARQTLVAPFHPRDMEERK